MIPNLTAVVSSFVILVALSGISTGQAVQPEERIEFSGALFSQATDQGQELLRFSPELLDEAKPTTHGFNPVKARTTAGVAMTFASNSPVVTLRFQAGARMPFGIFQNGKFLEVRPTNKQNGELKIASIDPGNRVEYRVCFPLFHNPVFDELVIEDGFQILDPPSRRSKVFVAIGDSITHGRGQEVSHQTWSWQVADALGMEHYNLAVGGSNANAHLPKAISKLPRVDLVSILWGYNDWVNRGKTIEEFTKDMHAAVDVIRDAHPETPIAVMRMLQTKTTVSKRTADKYSANDFRRAADEFVVSRQVAGDKRIHCVTSDSMTNAESDLKDNVHLTCEGATKLAKGIVGVLRQIVAAEIQPIEAQTSDKPNVLFIAIDDLKPMLGCYGHSEIISPSIDELAGRSTVFLNAHCQFPVCGGSRASLMTGLRPEATGVMDLKTSMRTKNPNVVTIAQHFRNHGYATAAVGKIYDPRCVDDKKTYDAPSWSIPYAGFDYSAIKGKNTKEVVVVSEHRDEELTDGWIRSQSIRLMRKLGQDENPFFLAVGFKKPHLPFVAPRKYWDLYSPDQINLAEYQGGIKNGSGYSLHNCSEFRGYEGVPASGPFPEDLQRRSIHGYRACISFIDAQVGMLLDELETLGLKDNTIIVLWGDHGFHLGDHGLFGKHTTLEQATRVPMMIHVPGSSGAQTNSPVELVDIFPTLSELSGLEDVTVNGRSLKPIIDNQTSTIREGALTVFKNKGAYGYSFRTKTHRYTEWINKNLKTVAKELYDYTSDPWETTNLADQPHVAQVQRMLASQLRDHAQGCERLKPSDNSVGLLGDPTTNETSQSVATAQSPPPATSALANRAHGEALRSVSAPGSKFPLLIGAATNARYWNTDTYETLNREFAYVTPGNDFKQSAIHPSPEQWKWKVADQWVQRCKENGQVMRLHGAIGPQCSKWAKSDDRTADELEENLVQFIKAISERYNDQPHVRWMDVVNETVSRNGEWFGPREGNDRWENPWPQLGIDDSHPLKPPVYIKLAFETANKYAPNINQLINQHGDMEPAMWDKIKGLVEYLKEDGVRVDGIGWQAHINTGFEKDPDQVQRLHSLISWAHARKLEFHVTEFTCWIRKKEKDAPVTAEDLQDQAKTYRAILDILHEHSGTGVVTWCAWQIKDTETERHYLRGNLYDGDGKPKPAYDAVRQFLTDNANNAKE